MKAGKKRGGDEERKGEVEQNVKELGDKKGEQGRVKWSGSREGCQNIREKERKGEERKEQ